MITPQTPAEGYGLGFSIDDEEGVTVVGHGGSVAGYNASLAFYPGSGLGVAMLRTTSYDPPVRELSVDLVRAGRKNLVTNRPTMGRSVTTFSTPSSSCAGSPAEW